MSSSISSQLPSRAQFIDKELNKKISQDILNNDEIYIRTIDMRENNMFIGSYGNSKLTYMPFMVGILGDGNKCCVILDKCLLYVDIRITEENKTELEQIIKNSDFQIYKVESVKGYPLMFYSEVLHNYYRVYFNNTNDRKKFIDYMTSEKNIMEVNINARKVITRDEFGEVITSEPTKMQKRVFKYELSSDDANYIYKMAREYKFNTADWNILPKNKYDVISTDDKFIKHLKIKTKYVFRINIEELKPVTNELKRKFEYLNKPRILSMCWDIETFQEKQHRKGSAPKPGDNYTIFCIGLSFHWYYTTEPLTRVCLTDLDCFTNDEMNRVEKLINSRVLNYRDGSKNLDGAQIANNTNSADNDESDDEDPDSPDDAPKTVRFADEDESDTDEPTAETAEDIELARIAAETNKATLEAIKRADDMKFKTVICGNEREILVKFGTIIEQMQPDLITGFNTGNFDTPLILDKLKKYTIYDEFISNISPIWLNPYNNSIRGTAPIKISATENVSITIFSVPGLIDTDTMIEFKKIFSRADVGNYFSLNFYLKECKLSAKDDMPMEVMFKIYESAYANNNLKLKPNELLQIFEKNIHINYPADTINKITEKIYNTVDMFHVAKYCVVDAFRCQQLWCIRSIFDDKSQIANQSYTPLGDSFYRANGVKVRNLIGATCFERNYKFSSCAKMPEQKNKYKYVGAWVFPPIKGLMKDIPVVGLDFASLYPSLMMTYNFSPEKIITDPVLADELRARGYDLHEIHAEYLLGGDKENKEPSGFGELAWSIRHNNVYEDKLNQQIITGFKYEEIGPSQYKETKIYGNRTNLPKECMGIFPAILEQLKANRGVVKKKFVACTQLLEAIEANKPVNPNDLIAADLLLPEKNFTANNLVNFADYANYEDYKAKIIANIDPHEIEFRKNIENTKQNAMKVFMNTFYGETGNSRSSIYKSMVAMGITQSGRFNIKRVYKFVTDKDYSVYYGDTDSLYISCPRKLLAELKASHFVEHPMEYYQDNYQENKSIENKTIENKTIENKTIVSADPEVKPEHNHLLKYFIELFNYTKINIGKLQKEVNNMLIEQTGAKYLSMAYEEVLCPVAFFGKKKYAGREHKETENYDHPAKNVFIRGGDSIKGGISGFVKEINTNVLTAMLNIYDRRDLKEIVDDEIINLATKKWDIKYFVRSAKYRPEKKNQCANAFMARMRPIYEQYLSMSRSDNDQIREKNINMAKLYEIPEAGDRYYTVIVNRNLCNYDANGIKITYNTADLLEFLRVYNWSNTDSSTIVPFSVNVRYYVDKNLAKSLSRFISYLPEYTEIAKQKMLLQSSAKKSSKKKSTDMDMIIVNEGAKYILNKYDSLTGYNKSSTAKYGQIYKMVHKNVSAIRTNFIKKSAGMTASIFESIEDSFADTTDNNTTHIITHTANDYFAQLSIKVSAIANKITLNTAKNTVLIMQKYEYSLEDLQKLFRRAKDQNEMRSGKILLTEWRLSKLIAEENAIKAELMNVINVILKQNQDIDAQLDKYKMESRDDIISEIATDGNLDSIDSKNNSKKIELMNLISERIRPIFDSLPMENYHKFEQLYRKYINVRAEINVVRDIPTQINIELDKKNKIRNSTSHININMNDIFGDQKINYNFSNRNLFS